MTFDLFADQVVEEPVAAPRRARASRELFAMQPTHDPNTWSYRDHYVTYDPRRETRQEMRWATIESMGRPILYGSDYPDVCRAIDARFATQEERPEQ